MKLIDGIKSLKGTPARIPENSRDDLVELFNELGYKVGAEVGVYKGHFTKLFCAGGLKMYAIDPWMTFGGQQRGQEDMDRQEFLYRHTNDVLRKWMGVGLCEIIRKTSAEAVKDFQPGELDFVYIDGDHSFSHIAHDIHEWSKVVRKGGIVSGHDYYNTRVNARTICHVGVVVDAYTRLCGIDNWWTFGWPSTTEDAESRRLSLSWMWFKTWSG